MRSFGILLFGLLASLSVPARAADLATIDCVADRIDQAVRDQLVKDVERNLTTTAPISYDPSVIQALHDGALACQQEHGWSAGTLQPVTAYTQAKLAWPVAQRLAAERGLDPAAMETIWLALPEDQRNKPLSRDARLKLAEAAIPEGPGRTAEAGHFVSGFFQLLSVMQYASFDFSQA
ncbi:MAG: hypothetical protein WDN44_02310 [Sphingomonas sp.]